MRQTLFYISILSILLIACGSPKQATNYRDLAQKSYEQGNYQQVIAELNKYLEEQELKALDPNPIVYSDISEAYFELGNLSEAERYFDWALTKSMVSENLLIKMSKYYNSIDNLSKEITTLEFYRDAYPKGKDTIMIRKHLFEAYMRSENWEIAQQSWNILDEETRSTEKFTRYNFDLNKELENNEQCDELALQLLEFNENNPEALEWMAKKYYDLGENRYQSAMKAYNKKKSTKNYNILLKELDMVTEDLKKSLTYFDKLWKMEEGKKYAIYLANIYARFDDKKKSQYYKSFIK